MTKKTDTPMTDDAIKAETVKSAAAQTTSKVVEGAREFVRRSAATAKERSDEMFDTTTKFNTGLEGALTKAGKGYVSILGGIAAATHDNFNRALTTVEKLANAGSVSDAVRIQADYVRENTTANLALVREAADTVRETATDGYSMVRQNVVSAWPYGKKAA